MLNRNFTQNNREQEESLKRLENAINQIFNKQSSKLSYDELYHAVYILVINRQQEQLYNETKLFLENNIKMKIKGFSIICQEKILHELLSLWREVNEMFVGIKSIYLFLNKNYIASKKLPTLLFISRNLFSKYFLNESGDLYEKLMNEMMDSFRKDRNNEIIDKVSLLGISSMMVI